MTGPAGSLAFWRASARCFSQADKEEMFGGSIRRLLRWPKIESKPV